MQEITKGKNVADDERVFAEYEGEDLYAVIGYALKADGVYSRILLRRLEILALAEFAGFKVFDVKPMVSAEEVAAIKIVAPGAKWIARDVTGDVFAYTNKPTLRGLNYWEGDCRAARLPFLEERFANVPWKESLMEI